jgi:hypothetical protein
MQERSFDPTSAFMLVTPVALPPGRFKLATSPASMGSAAVARTIGIVAVAPCTADCVPPAVTITVT